MTSRIEQDHEQHPDFALILPRGAAYAPLPQATEAGAKARSPTVAALRDVTRNGKSASEAKITEGKSQ